MNIIPGLYVYDTFTKYFLVEVNLETDNAKLAFFPGMESADRHYCISYMVNPVNNWQPA